VNNRRLRWTIALLTAATTGAVYAEGVLISGWIEVMLFIPIVLLLLPTQSQSLDRILQNGLITITAISLSVVGLDLILRPTFAHKLHYGPMNITSHKLPELPIVARWNPNLNIDMDSYGDLAAMVGDPAVRELRKLVFQTDAYGFRNGPQSHPIDVLILGDSFPAGSGTTEDEVFARVLETSYGVHTYNLAFPGGPYDQFINFAIEWPRLKVAPNPRMVWTFYTGNDMDDAAGELWDLAHLPWNQGLSAWRVAFKSYRSQSPLRQLFEVIRIRIRASPKNVIIRLLPDGSPVLFFENQENWGKASRQKVEQYPTYPKLIRTMNAMHELTTERHVQLTVLILPTKGEVYRWLLDARNPQPEDQNASGFAIAILEACKNMGLVCVDMKPFLISEAEQLYKREGKLLWWRDDTHIGKYGHAAIAAYIAETVLNKARMVGQ
jgi:hypothetical protein